MFVISESSFRLGIWRQKEVHVDILVTLEAIDPQNPSFELDVFFFLRIPKFGMHLLGRYLLPIFIDPDNLGILYYFWYLKTYLIFLVTFQLLTL